MIGPRGWAGITVLQQSALIPLGGTSGSAAAYVGGTTVHSAYGQDARRSSKEPPPLSEAKTSTWEQKLVLVIDRASMPEGAIPIQHRPPSPVASMEVARRESRPSQIPGQAIQNNSWYVTTLAIRDRPTRWCGGLRGPGAKAGHPLAGLAPVLMTGLRLWTVCSNSVSEAATYSSIATEGEL